MKNFENKFKQISIVFEASVNFNELVFIQEVENMAKQYKDILLIGKHIKVLEKRE
jgi:hypothetical protein